MSSSKSSLGNSHKFKDRREENWRSKAKPSLTEEEKELRRQEMMANAVWRDKEREKTLEMYRDEEKRESQNSKLYNKDFIRYVIRPISFASSMRISSINNVQNCQINYQFESDICLGNN